MAGSYSRAQTSGKNPVGSKSNIPLHKGKKTRSLIRWGACISKVVEAAECLAGNSEPRSQGSVAGHCHHQSPQALCRGEWEGAGLGTKQRGRSNRIEGTLLVAGGGKGHSPF